MASYDCRRLANGHWQPRLNLSHLYYGPGCVQDQLLGALPSPDSRAFIITGASLASQTPLVKRLQTLLDSHHAGTISTIKQHGPAEDVEEATNRVLDENVDVLISVGGGSPIDTAKVISFRANERKGAYLTHLTIPTTLSAAECTAGGGYTKVDGTKVGFRAPGMGVTAIFYDPDYASHTPKDLWLSTGMRAMDHAVESLYHPTASEVPWKALSLWAAGELFECLPKSRDSHPEDPNVMVRLMLAAFASSGLKGEDVKGGMGLSHSLGHALGSPYGIPHGITSCVTLPGVVRLKAKDPDSARQIARLLPAFRGTASADPLKDAFKVGDQVAGLVDSLGLTKTKLSAWQVSEDQASIIAQRALGGISHGPQFETVMKLVLGFFSCASNESP